MFEKALRIIRHLVISKLVLLSVLLGGLVLFMGVSYLSSSEEVAEVVPETNTQTETETEDTFGAGAAIYERYSARIDRVEVLLEVRDYERYRLTTNELVREGELNTERGFGDDIDATVYVLNWRQPEGQQMRYVRLTGDPEKLYVLDSAGEIVRGGALVRERMGDE